MADIESIPARLDRAQNVRLDRELVETVLDRWDGYPQHSLGTYREDDGMVRFLAEVVIGLSYESRGYHLIEDLHGPGQVRIKADVIDRVVAMLNEAVRDKVPAATRSCCGDYSCGN